ncbi:hypothetical protein CHUAL_008906 [Chamberlinius hualienensis]|uniref:Cytochrome P450 3200D1 n=1 Tax=Chamberlinius hualienensis TaxID=1551368 RepID=A0A1J1DVQ9_9MYRI|nr:cytochrome P450 3200D1 [Chamberlinius hualienensis]
MVAIILIGLLVILGIAYWYLSIPKRLPPGSAGLPIVGYLPFVDPQVHFTFTKLGRKYGKIFHVYMGSRLVVVLNDFSALKEAYVKQADNFAGRPSDMNYKDKPEDNMGLVADDGELWLNHRRFMVSKLRDYGMGKSKLEPLIMDEVRYVISEMRKANGQPMDMKDLLCKSFANTVLILLTGQRFGHDHAYITNTIKAINDFMPLSQMVAYHIFFPWIRSLPGSQIILQHKKIRDIIESYLKMCEEMVKATRKSFSSGNDDNYVHAYLTEQLRRSKDGRHDDIFNDTSLVHNCRDIIVAGSETSSTTTMWVLLYMTNYPEIATKCQQEVDRVIGRDRDPSINDRKNTPYVDATLCEIERLAAALPIGLSHRNKADAYVDGHRIPKDTLILTNVWHIHHDPQLWGDPYNFRPERFIDSDGKVCRPEYLIPFGIGKRICVGESLARMELYLYFTSILQHFNFALPNRIRPGLDSKPGLTRQPKDCVICLVPRQD